MSSSRVNVGGGFTSSLRKSCEDKYRSVSSSQDVMTGEELFVDDTFIVDSVMKF